MPVIEALLAKAPALLVRAVVGVVRAIMNSPDPMRAAKRAALAAAADEGAEAALKQILGRRPKK
jgi:hypothetical protein